jgi:protein tyrosine/serine phosphatase
MDVDDQEYFSEEDMKVEAEQILREAEAVARGRKRPFYIS